MNVTGPAPVPNLTVVEGAVGDRLCVSASRPMDVLVDGFVSFDPTNGVTVGAPDRVLDTRTAGGSPLAAGAVAVLDGARLGVGPGTTGVMLNLTAVSAQGVGFLAAYPCAAGVPTTSSLNYVPGSVAANFVIVPPDTDGDVCVFTLTGTHVVVDLVGTTTEGFIGGAPQRLIDTRQRPAA